MDARLARRIGRLLPCGVMLLLLAGCASNKMVPPLYATTPRHTSLPRLSQISMPSTPAQATEEIVITLPMQPQAVDEESAIMRKGVVIAPGSSVVISVPASISKLQQNPTGNDIADDLGFRTDGFFNVLEQYIERGLLSAGFHVKDRSKFEAKLRDLRDSTAAQDQSYEMALESLQKDLDAGKISREEFIERSKALRQKNLSPSSPRGGSSGHREEMSDISEVIRAAQDGDVMADYVLQVNELSVQHFSGTQLQLSERPEIQKALEDNPGLRLGPSAGKTLPATLRQPWAQARFNAKLIDVKTGSIDWIGEYSIESLSVLEDGIAIKVGIRRRVSNGKLITGAIQDHNEALSRAHAAAAQAKRTLDSLCQDAMRTYPIEGGKEEIAQIQSGRRYRVEQAEEEYETALENYRELARQRPRESRLDWVFDYDVDTPVVSPDLLNPRTEQEGQRLLEHVRALGSKVTRELLGTIRMSEE